MKIIKKILFVLLAVIGFIVFVILKEINKAKQKEKFNNVMEQIFENKEVPEIKQFIIGTTDYKIRSPYQLVESTVALPEIYKERLEKMEVFEFVKNPFFKGKITYLKWDNSVGYDLDRGLDSSLESVRQLPGVEKVVDDRIYFENSRFQSYYYDAIMLRDGQSLVMKGVILKSGQETMQIIIEPVNSENEEMIKSILESLKENK